ncbi:MAG: hypothetical protein Q8K79_15765 [Solirubrobacteraceae bacterium]|nr:hypothetical protein [Solirubrobacteraceae bacterium]
MDYEVELQPGRDQTEESLVVRHADGTTDEFRLHEYERVYAIAGLYEEVVQRRLLSASATILAERLVACAAEGGTAAADLAVFDLGAGNGVSGEELRARGVGTIVASDGIPEARAAARRDRPGLYAEYLVGDTDDLAQVPELIREHGLNALVCAGALGLGHISADSFHRLWTAFPPGAWFSVSLHEDLAVPGGSDFGDYLAGFEERAGGGEILVREPFRHRLTMAGEPITYVAVVARKPAA